MRTGSTSRTASKYRALANHFRTLALCLLLLTFLLNMSGCATTRLIDEPAVPVVVERDTAYVAVPIYVAPPELPIIVLDTARIKASTDNGLLVKLLYSTIMQLKNEVAMRDSILDTYRAKADKSKADFEALQLKYIKQNNSRELNEP